MKSSHEKALSKKKVNNLVKGKTGKLNEKGNKAKLSYKFQKDEGAKNNDSEED